MKITYILKKGLYIFPPCLAQVLYLNDLGVDLTVFHGIESPSVKQLLQDRGIKNYVLNSDNTSTGIISALTKFRKYSREIRQILLNISDDEIIWFGNLESAVTLKHELRNKRYIWSILELHGFNLKGFFSQSLVNMKATLLERIYRGDISIILKNALVTTCCEPHRAAIMRGRYGLPFLPYVLPNKPYEIDLNELSEVPPDVLKTFQRKFVILYQGIIDPERPLLNIALALNKLNDDNVVFAIMGRITESDGEHIVDELITAYKNTVYLGFVPNPQHLTYTKWAQIGIASYDDSCLNTIFCAPNKIYEYARFGVPMLCSQNIGLVETVGAAGAGECVDYDNVDSIVCGLKKIMANSEYYKKHALDFYNSTDNQAVIKTILKEISMKIEKTAFK